MALVRVLFVDCMPTNSNYFEVLCSRALLSTSFQIKILYDNFLNWTSNNCNANCCCCCCALYNNHSNRRKHSMNRAKKQTKKTIFNRKKTYLLEQIMFAANKLKWRIIQHSDDNESKWLSLLFIVYKVEKSTHIPSTPKLKA